MEWTTELTFSNMDDYKEFVREMRARYNIPRRIGNREILPDEGRSRRGGSVSINAINCNKRLNEYYKRGTRIPFVKYFDEEPIPVENDVYWCSFRVEGYYCHKEDGVNVREVKLYECMDEEGNPVMPPVDIEDCIEDYVCHDYRKPSVDYDEDEIDITSSKSLTSSGGYGYPYLSIRREIAGHLIDLAHSINSSYSFINEHVGDRGQLIYDIVHAGVVIGTFEVFTDCPYNSPYRYFFHHKRRPNGEWQGMNQDEFKKDFENFAWFNDGHPVHS